MMLRQTGNNCEMDDIHAEQRWRDEPTPTRKRLRERERARERAGQSGKGIIKEYGKGVISQISLRNYSYY